jgi:hypothetical protein
MVGRRDGPYVRRMVTLHIEHPITDYATWRAAFDGFAGARRDGGVIAERVARPVDDDAAVVIDLDFATEERAAAFRGFLEARVWSTPANSPGLAGRPLTRILREA